MSAVGAQREVRISGWCSPAARYPHWAASTNADWQVLSCCRGQGRLLCFSARHETGCNTVLRARGEGREPVREYGRRHWHNVLRSTSNRLDSPISCTPVRECFPTEQSQQMREACHMKQTYRAVNVRRSLTKAPGHRTSPSGERHDMSQRHYS